MQDFGGETRRKKPFGRLRHRWENIIEMNFKEIGLEAWTGLMWLRRGSSGKLLGTP